MQSETKEEFLEKVSEMYEVTAKINNAKRNIIKKRISLDACPLYTLGYMSLNKQKYCLKNCLNLSRPAAVFSNSVAEKNDHALDEMV